MRLLIFILLLTLQFSVKAQSANRMLYAMYKQFDKVKTFKSKVHVDFNIPSINIDTMSGRAYYKAPSKFRVKFNGIAFLPKDNPFLIYRLIKDSASYMAFFNEKEWVRTELCSIIHVIPKTETDIIMAKFWISAAQSLPLKMQITSRSNGVILIENYYGKKSQYGLPDMSVFTIDMKTFKVPKMVSADLNAKSRKNTPRNTTGTVIFKFSSYVINAAIDDKVFTEK